MFAVFDDRAIVGSPAACVRRIAEFVVIPVPMITTGVFRSEMVWFAEAVIVTVVVPIPPLVGLTLYQVNVDGENVDQ